MLLYVVLRAIFDRDIWLQYLWRAIFDCDLRAILTILSVCNFWLRSSRKLFFDCNLWLRYSRKLLFNCNLRVILRSVQQAILDWDLRTNFRPNFSSHADCLDTVSFGISFAFGRCLFQSFFRTMPNLLLTFERISFGRRLFQRLFLISWDAACLDAVSLVFSFAFGRCLFWTFFRPLQGSDAVSYLPTRIFWTPSLSDAITLVFSDVISFGCCFFWTRMLFFGHWCFCFSKRGCSFLDASALLWTRMLSSDVADSSDADSYRGLLTTFTCVPWYTYLAI